MSKKEKVMKLVEEYLGRTGGETEIKIKVSADGKILFDASSKSSLSFEDEDDEEDGTLEAHPFCEEPPLPVDAVVPEAEAPVFVEPEPKMQPVFIEPEPIPEPMPIPEPEPLPEPLKEMPDLAQFFEKPAPAIPNEKVASMFAEEILPKEKEEKIAFDKFLFHNPVEEEIKLEEPEEDFRLEDFIMDDVAETTPSFEAPKFDQIHFEEILPMEQPQAAPIPAPAPAPAPMPRQEETRFVPFVGERAQKQAAPSLDDILASMPEKNPGKPSLDDILKNING